MSGSKNHWSGKMSWLLNVWVYEVVQCLRGTMSRWHKVWVAKCLVVKMCGCQQVGCKNVRASKYQFGYPLYGIGPEVGNCPFLSQWLSKAKLWQTHFFNNQQFGHQYWRIINNIAQQYCQQYCWIVKNISNIVCNIAKIAILLTILPAIMLTFQPNWWQYCWSAKLQAILLAKLLTTLPAILLI